MSKAHALSLVLASMVAACGGNVDGDPTAPPPGEEKPACAAPGETRPLASTPGFFPGHFVSDGATLYAGGLTEPGPSFALRATPITSPASPSIDDARYAHGAMAIGPGRSLVYLTGEATPASATSLSVRQNGVVMRDAGGRTTAIVEGGTESLASLAADGEGVSWVTTQPLGSNEPNTLWRWDAATGEKRVLARTLASRAVGDGSEIFYAEWSKIESPIMAISIAGGTARLVGKAGPSPTIIAVDSVALYYVESESKDSLFVMSKTTGDVLRIIAGVSVPWIGAVADETHIYWAAQANPPRRLMRLEKARGTTEELLRDDWLGPAVGVDACNVYYSAGSESVTFARSK